MKMDRLEKAIKKQDTKQKKHYCSNSDLDSKNRIGSGSIEKKAINLGETVEKL
jgi:hypothetical protein